MCEVPRLRISLTSKARVRIIVCMMCLCTYLCMQQMILCYLEYKLFHDVGCAVLDCRCGEGVEG
jgi:hypothetical protein